MVRARRLLAVAALLLFTSSCVPASPSRATAGASPLRGNAVAGVGIGASLGWDGVDNRTMLVANVIDSHTRLANVGVWTLTSSGWQPMRAPSVVADDLGFDSLYLAYDSGRRVEMLISTSHSLPGRAVVSEWDGHSWRNVESQDAPTALLYGAYSPELRAWVGIGEGTPYRTWLYDGTAWRAAAVGGFVAPGALESVAYDPTRHRVLALWSNFATWQFDGSTWTAIQAAPPVPSSEGAITFDPRRGQWVIFGGFAGRGTAETWIGYGASWNMLSPQASPPPRFELKSTHLSWDPQLGRAVLFGGIFPFCCELVYSDTWQWDGKSWRKLLDAAPLANPAFLPAPEPCVASPSHGLLIAAGKLEMIDTCGKVGASAPLAPSTLQTCATGGATAVVEPPVSATRDRVFYRDGDTKIRSLSMDGTTADVTTVPGGPSTVSMFSVSPDDQRIAVIVEDVSPADSINLRLYVEDLKGAGHHADIYAKSFSKQDGTTLWPMGWHQGLLVLAVMKACAADAAAAAAAVPFEWHLVDPATADRKFTLRDASCTFGLWPSPAGAACELGGYIRVYDWTSALVSMIRGLNARTAMPSGVSPSGLRAYYESPEAIFCSGLAPMTLPLGSCMVLEGGREVRAEQRLACLWIDDDHLLAPDAVIGLPSPKFPYAREAPEYPLPAAGQCAGRFPGGL
jgi:hypothetical protein